MKQQENDLLSDRNCNGILNNTFSFADKLRLPYKNQCRRCQNVEETESVYHLLCECPALQDRRHRFLGSKTFEDLEMVQNKPLIELASFIRGWWWFKPTTNGAGHMNQ